MNSMKYLYAYLLIVVTISASKAQNFERISYGSESNDYYVALRPASENIMGVLVLMPGFGQVAERIFPESKIQNVAYVNNILTIALPCPQKLYADDTVIGNLNKAIEHIKATFKISADKFVIGGFSAGGTISLRYTEYCYNPENEAPIKPKAVFSIDSPVDLFHIWDYFERELERNFSEVGMAEAKYVRQLLLNEIGDPLGDQTIYDKLTPFNMTKKEKGNEQYLVQVAVRTYHELSTDWLINQRHRSLIDTNAVPASEMINRLRQSGNNIAEFIQAEKAGYRSSGQRHPHAWSIVDEVELIQWIKSQLN